MSTVTTTTASSLSSSQRRKRLRLKRIVVSEYNYLALKRLGLAGDSFKDVISKLLRIQRIYEEKRQQLLLKQQERSKENHMVVNNQEIPFPKHYSELYDEHER